MAKPNDIAATPSGKLVRVIEVRPGRARLCQYLDTCEGIEIADKLLTVQVAAPVRPWKERVRL